MKEQFKNIDFRNEVIEREYIGVSFDHCDFSEVMFGDVLFEDCQFKACNLSLCKSKATSWNNVSFIGCKMTGINFSEANRFAFRVGFIECQLQFASSELSTNKEIDSYQWFTPEDARRNIRPNSLAESFLNAYLDE